MRKSIQRVDGMTLKSGLGISVLLMGVLTGCAGGHALWGATDGVVYREDVVYSDGVSEERDDGVQEEGVKVVNNGFVDYRQTASDYREYGERTPRDSYIVNGGVGSNMSASIPPTIEEEIVSYDDAVNTAFNGALGEIQDSSSFSGDDAVEDWLAEEGSTLKGLLSDWCERAGWRLVWNSNRNYTLGAGAMFRGRFADVSSALIRNFARAKPAPIATFYKGNRVLVVETREDENAFN